MRYIDFKNAILAELRRHPDGLTWLELKENLKLPYSMPCQTWIQRMEEEDGLQRVKGSRRALIWKVKPD